MRLRRLPKHSLSQQLPSPRGDARSWRLGPYPEDAADQVESRHDSQMLNVRSVPVDPYTAWLDQHTASGFSQAVSAPVRRAGRITRRRSTKAPWESITVTLTPDRGTQQPH